MNLSIDCKKMLIPKARRKTPLKKAPSNRARCQPNESSAGERARSDIWARGELESDGVNEVRLTMTAVKATMKPIRSFIYEESAIWACLMRLIAQRSYVVECIGKKRKRAGLEGHCESSQSQDKFECAFADGIDEPVISATKNAKEMEIVMMSRVLGLRLNAMLMEEWVRMMDAARTRSG